MFKQVFYRAKLVYEFHGCLLANTWTSRYIIGCIAHESEQVDDLGRGVDAVLLAYFFRTEYLKLLITELWSEHSDVFADQLTVIFVGGHHESLQSIDISCLCGKSANDVICLKSADFEDRDIVCFEYALYVWYGSADAFRSFFSLCLVGFVCFMTERRSRRVKCNTNVRRLFLIEHFLQSVDKSKYG